MKHSILDRTRFISLVLTIMIVLSIVAVPVSAGTQLTVTFDIKHDQVEARKMLDMINNIRLNDAWLWKSEDGDEKIQITGLSKLTYDYTLEKIAIQRAEELGKHYECGVRPDGSDFSKLEINDVNSFCECICSNVQSVNAAFAEFEEKNEPNHWQDNREALLSRDYSAIAIAHVKFGAKDFWVSMDIVITLDAEDYKYKHNRFLCFQKNTPCFFHQLLFLQMLVHMRKR